MKVNFNSILENYNSEIENKLRGFNTDLDYLKYWVPSPNTVESVYNLISNFRECDIKDVTIEFNKNYLNSEQIDKILKLKENVGDIKYFVENNKHNFSVKIEFKIFDSIKSEIQTIIKKKEELYLSKIDLSFRKKLFTESLKSFLNNYNYIDIQNEIKIKEKLIKIKKNFLENQLIFYIENDSWILKDIKFFKKNEMDDNSNLVDKFIKVYKPVCLNLPFREVLDHSLIYFFYKYFKLEIKNTGIFHYENYGLILIYLKNILKEVYGELNTKNGMSHIKVNKYYQSISNEWKKKTIEDKEKIINKLILDFCNDYKIEKNKINFKQIEDNFKIILDVDGEISNSNINQSNYILMLENFFKKNCDFRIELFLGEKRDSNKLRL
tara:strand:+ start:939 stop:2081 length:1143 start_codon:yes stop_codon:yes gene_type:complete